MVYLRIRSSGYSFGWTSDTEQAAFKEESRRLFQELGWTLQVGHNGVCDTVTKGHQDLYLHPLSFSGVMDEANIQPLQEQLSKAQTFNCYHCDCYHGFSYLAPHILPQPDLYGLNALAEKLLELNEYEATAFHGLVRMEADKADGKLSVRRLLDLAYSTDCCHVVADVLNYSQLGRFYADNGFVPEVENLSDEAFDLLDFELIGRRMKSGEDGVFMERSADEPGGYVVRHEELRQAPPIPSGPPQKPDYIFRLNLRLLPAISVPPDGKKLVEIDLPATEKQIMSALDMLGASGLNDTMGAILDGPLPGLRSEVFAGSEILLVNELAERVRDMSDKDLGVLKAVMEEVGFDTLDGVIELAGRTGEYIFEPGIRGVEQAAEAELNAMLGEKDADLIMRHLNLYAYGKALLEQENAVITPYGRLQRRDGQPIQAMEQEPGMGGMEGMA